MNPIQATYVIKLQKQMNKWLLTIMNYRNIRNNPNFNQKKNEWPSKDLRYRKFVYISAKRYAELCSKMCQRLVSRKYAVHGAPLEVKNSYVQGECQHCLSGQIKEK